MLLSRSMEIGSREDFGILCNHYGVRIAVEVGTDQGVFAAQFMKQFKGHELICIDDYEPYEWMTGTRFPDMLMAAISLRRWHGRVRIIQDKASNVAKVLPFYITNRLDFVYIDADHSYEGVKEDIESWWPLLQSNGILAGHDFDKDHPGVIKAVSEFAEDKNLHVFLTDTEVEFPSSWFVYKNKPSALWVR